MGKRSGKSGKSRKSRSNKDNYNWATLAIGAIIDFNGKRKKYDGKRWKKLDPLDEEDEFEIDVEDGLDNDDDHSYASAKAVKSVKDAADKVNLAFTNNALTFTDADGTSSTIDLSKYVDTNASTITSGSLNSSTGICTFTRDNNTTFTVNMSALLDDTDTNTWRGIQNNLTSTSTVDSLSAKQGKELKILVDSKASSSHTHTAPTWGSVTGKPTTFTPSTHTHNYLPLTGGTLSGHTKWTGLDFSINTDNSTGGTANYFRGTSSHLVIGTGGTLYLNYGNNSGQTRHYGTQYVNNTEVIGTDAKIDAGRIKNVPDAWLIGEGTNTDTWRGISDSVSSTSTTISASSKAVKTVNDKVNALSSTDTWRGIQNNLTSDSTTDSLSAKQGKELKSLIAGSGYSPLRASILNIF